MWLARRRSAPFFFFFFFLNSKQQAGEKEAPNHAWFLAEHSPSELSTVDILLTELSNCTKLQVTMKFFTHGPFAWRKKSNPKRVVGKKNPLAKTVLMLKRALPTWNRFFETSVEDRTMDWDDLDELFDPLCDYYSWAIPDERALNIISEFSPLIEIGCGHGYWAALLQNRGVDIVPFDVYSKPKKCWTTVYKGGPEIISHRYARNRNLFLCYPDEQESIAFECLENFTGEYVIHVGELITTGTMGGPPQAPFGRTSSSAFQLELMSTFHCVLAAELYLALPFSKDCITVWKRSNFVLGRVLNEGMSDDEEEEDDDDDDDEDDDDDDDDEEDDDDDAMEYMSAADLQQLRIQGTAISTGSGGSGSGSSGKVTSSSGGKGNKARVGSTDDADASTLPFAVIGKALTLPGSKAATAVGGVGVTESASSSSSSAVSYMSMEELQLLRASNETRASSGQGKRGKKGEDDDDDDDDDDDEDEDEDDEEDDDEGEEDDDYEGGEGEGGGEGLNDLLLTLDRHHRLLR